MSIGETSGPNYAILAHRFASSGQWDRALATSREWLSKDPENRQAHRVAGQSLISLRRAAEAQGHLEKVLAGNPRDDFAHRLMSMVHWDQDRFQAADESIRQAIALNPRDALHWHQSARLSYHLGDLVTARKCAERARELNPRDPNILNLLILCEPNNPDQARQKIKRYEEALALDPENSSIHNNIGVQYLGPLKDYASAEECFRRSLALDPTSKLVRGNLFLTLKHRDPVYRVLSAPKDFLFQVWSLFSRARKHSIILYILAIPLWLIAFRFVLGGLALWFILVWPLTKVYEYLTIGDIRAQAGELGARHGGFLGYRRWPLNLRLSIFAACLIGFWGAVAFFVISSDRNRDPETRQIILGTLLFLGLIVWLVFRLRSKIRKGARSVAARKRARHINEILEPQTEKRRWWQFSRRNTGSL